MPTTGHRPRWDPDSLARLEYERAVLLRDLRELDEQHSRSEVSAQQYETLRDELTARTAEVIGLINRGRAATPARPRRPWTTASTVAGLVLAAVLTGWLLTTQLAPRVAPAPPQATADTELSARVARLAVAVGEKPDDVPARLALARLLLQAQDLPAALDQFDAIAELDPTHVEALAYGGWVAVLVGDTTGGLDRLDRAVAADDRYPDAHALRGLALMRAGKDDAAATELRRYIELAPAGPLADQVRSVIARLGGGS